MTRPRLISILLILAVAPIGCGFAGSPATSYNQPGFFAGIWHGLLAPYTLIIRIFLDIQMYAVPNSGWLYDCGFLIGVAGALPIGWLAAIIQLALHFLA